MENNKQAKKKRECIACLDVGADEPIELSILNFWKCSYKPEIIYQHGLATKGKSRVHFQAKGQQLLGECVL